MLREAADRLARFASVNDAAFYGLPLNIGTITLVDEPWVVPAEIGGVVPFMAGETLAWQVKSAPVESQQEA
jgi:dihydroorotase